jgi:tetratricopeptide (TPR) repeat protein
LRAASRKIVVIQMYYKSRIFAVVALIVLVAAGIYSIRAAIADAAFRRSTPEGVKRAVEIAPDNARYLLFRALQLDYDGQDATPLLERAARLNPLSSASRIRLGLAAETRGDLASAEKWLLDAARVDHQFEPRWTLANFYFRQNRPDDFWRWMHDALEVSYGDRRLAFDLCWRMAVSPDEILARGIPDRREVVATYLYYLMDQHRDAVGPVALKLAAIRDPADTEPLEAACDLLIESGDAGRAREVWRGLGHNEAALLTNGDFANEPRNHGFDWRLARPSGVTHVQLNAPAAHRITLSGKQPEACELLRQWLALEPGKRYTLHWEVRTQGMLSPTGIDWNAGVGRSPVENSDDWRIGSAEFVAPAALVPLTLTYMRPTGQPRAEGSVEIRSVSLAETPR